MARTIQIKRGLEKNLPTLKPGEQAFTTDTKKVFVGSDTGNIDITNSVDTTKLATKTELGTVTAALAETENMAPLTFIPVVTQPAYTEKGGYNTYITEKWEALRAKYPDYIKRETLGKDQSGTYDIYSYSFEPKYYAKEILITANVHGNEKQSTYSLFHIMKDITENYRDYPQLKYLRFNTKIVVIPSMNPWGFSNNSRPNSRHVDVNRNMDLFWEKLTESTYTDPTSDWYKGSAPLSEAESIIYTNWIARHKSANYHLDFHAGSHLFDFPMYSSGAISNNYSKLNQLFTFVKTQYPDKTVGADLNTGNNLDAYANYRHSIPAHTIEHASELWGTRLGSEDMTAAYFWFINHIIAGAMLDEKVIVKNEPFVKQYLYTTTTVTVPSSKGEIAETTIPVIPIVPGKGFVELDGHIIVTKTDGTSFCNVYPYLYQNFGINGYNTSLMNLQAFNDKVGIYTTQTGSIIIPISAVCSVIPSDGSPDKQCMFKLFMNDSAGNTLLKRVSIRVKYTPSDVGVNAPIISWYKKSDGTMNESILFPTGNYKL